VEIENTTNKGGGTCWDFNEILKIKKVCDKHQLGLHLDGARLWNALVAKDEKPKQYGDVFDTISVCLSKGLGCPVGSVLVGDSKIMKDAIRLRKIFGGNMRQAGYLAAAGLYALENNIERLKEDHAKAKEIGGQLAKLPEIKSVEPVETNIVIFELNDGLDEKKFINRLKERNIHIISMGNGKLRVVTHLNYKENMHNKVMKTIASMY
jgi:threonine aldolase